MLTFKFFKRLLALIVVLLVAVSADAQMKTYTVSNTNSSGAGSFQDAINTVNAEGGSWTIKFEIPTSGDTILITSPVAISNVKELNFVGNDKSVLKWNGDFTLNSVANFSSDKMRFFSNDGGTFKLKGNNMVIDHISNCVFENVGITSTSLENLTIKIISYNSFINNKLGKILYINSFDGVHVIESIEHTSFDDTYDGGQTIIVGNKGEDTNCTKLSYCDFHTSGNWTLCGNFKTIEYCTFTSDKKSTNSKVTEALYYVFCDILKNSTFTGYGANINEGTYGLIQKCSFNEGNIYDFVCQEIVNSSFKDVEYITGSKVNLISGCDFNNSKIMKYANNNGNTIKEIADCSFIIEGAQPLRYDTENSYIHDNKFEISGRYSAIYNDNSSSIAGRYSKNLIIYSDINSNMFSPIYKSNSKSPTLLSVSLKNGIFKITGSSGPNADVEIFQNNGDGVSTIKYLTTVQSDANGDFQASIAASALDVTGNSCFIATATYDESRTSVLSKSICYELPLDVYVKKTGNGSGKNWKDAISEDDFYGILPIAKDGTTFHIAEGVYEIDNQVPNTYTYLYVNSSIKIIGGYPETNEEDVTKVKSNPTLYSTNFKRIGTWNAPYFMFNKTGIEVEFHNVEFTDTWLAPSTASATPVLKNLVIDSCSFSNCIALKGVSSDNLEIRNSLFSSEKDNSPITFNRYKGTAAIENSTFIATSGKGSLLTMEQLSDVRVSNCTFYSKTESDLIHICADNKLELLNNTFIGGSDQSVVFSTDYPQKTKIVGNITYGICKSLSQNKEFNTDKYNVISIETSGSNTYVSDFTTILEGKNVDGKFVPTLAYNGGFTPTVKLISDKLADGSSFRFPLEETSVTADQRGETRLTSTCPGAYEIPFIVPDLKEIYVKQSGKGSGASWTDAMSPKDFVNVLPFANEGTTFYVAAGTYDFNKLSDGKYVYENKNYSYTYENYPVKNGVIIRGGYPENPTSEVPSDPATNKTTFTSLYKASSRDASVLQFLSSSELHNLYFDDLLLEVNKADGEMTPTLLIDSCVISATEANFTYDYKNINHINVQKGGLDVRNTTFNGYCGYLINASECSAVYIQNSTFAPTKVSGSTSIMLGTTKTSVVWIVNNTFYKAESASLIQCGSSCPLQFYNNTVVSKYGYRLIGSLDAVGNLFYSISDAKGSYMYAQKPQSNMYNVVVGTDGYDGDMMVAAADLATILSGSVVGGSFEPELANNGGYTQTVKLVGTKLPDGTSIKFPRSASGIYVDQRDVARMENTCAGAYELSVAGLNEVYVKKDGQGNGTNWDDAMSEADFFAALPLAKEGTTFYVAAGEYVKTESSPVWLRNGIKVIGGYPAKAKKGAVSDPVNNHTVLKASSDKASMTISYMYNFDCGSGKQTAEFHNLDFFGTRLDLNVDNIVIDSCNFYECYNPVNVNCAQNLRISNSYFALNKVKSDKFDYSININCDPVAVIENCTFDEKPYTTAIKVDSELDTASVRIVNNTFLLRDRANTEWADEEGEHYYFYMVSKKLASFLHNTIAIVNASGYLNVSESINKIGIKKANFYYNLFTISDSNLFSIIGEGGCALNYNLFGKNDQGYNVYKELKNILDGTDNGVGFIPTLAYNGGYTPTIKLEKDRLSDGVLARTSQIATYIITTDQRGVTRKTSSTCFGAYEFECSKGEFAVNKSTIKVSKPNCNLSPNGGVDLKIGNWVDGCKAYFYKGEEELWSVDALDSPNNKYKLRIADNAIEDLFNGAKYVDSVIFSYFGLSGGSYSFVLEDLCGNKTTTPITVDPIEKPSFVVSKSSKTELSCYNSTDGSIEITLVGGELELCGKASSYDIKGLEFTEKNRTVKATGLTPGSYRFVYGTTAKMCSDNADTTIVITAPDTVKAKCDFKDAYCAEIGGSATFTAEGGVGNYSVTISDISGNVFKKESFAGKNTVTVGGMKLSTTYSAVVEDANGCQAKQLGGIRFWLKEVPKLETSINPSNETCYNENDGRIELAYSGNNNKDELVVSAIGSDGKPHNAYFSEANGSVIIEGLAPGEYTIKYDFGAEGCNTPGDNATTIGKVTIGKVDKPTLLDVSDETVIRCKGRTLSRKIEVTNYNKKLYTWKLTKDGVDITSEVDATVPTTEDGEFVFKCLTAGDYVFSLVDQCGNPFSKSFTVLESLKKTMKVVDNSGGVSCEGKSDAHFDINVTNWNTGDKCSITNAETGEELEVSKTTKGTYISFFTYHLPGGKYNVDVTDLCGTTYPTVVIDLDELGKESKFGLSLAEAASDAECNEDSRKISATVTGRETGSTYSYTLYQVTGEGEKVIDDKQKEVADKTYTSGKLDYGTYKLAAVTSEGCEASVERTFSASHSLTGTRLVCGENSHVELNYDGLIEGVSVKIGGKWSDIDFAEDADKSSFDCKGVVTDVRVKETGCYTVAALSDYDLTGNLFEGVTAKASAVDQTCYGKDNGSIKVTYSGYKGKMQVVAYAVNDKGDKLPSVFDPEQKCLLISNLAPGAYNVQLGLSIEGCEVSGQSFDVAKAITIAALEKPEFLEDRYGVAHNQCEGMAKGRMHLEMNGWKDGIYTWSLQRSFDQGKPAEYTHCGEKLNGATTFDLWSLPEGKTIFTMWDACDTIYKKVENIKAAYVDPVEIKMGDCTPISCADRTDGSVIFVASHWDIPYQASVILDGDTALKDFRPVIKADDKAYFELKGQGAGIYQLATKDACERTVDSEPFDFTAFSAQNGMLTVKAVFDEDAEECEIGKRVIKATATGGTAPYIFSIEKNGTAVESSEAIDATSYGSKLLGEGKYTVSVTDKTDCKAVYGENLTIKSEKLNVKLGSLTNIEQTCYGKDNAGVSVSYSGFDTEMAKLRLLVTEKTEAETKKTYEAYADANEGTLAYTKLPTGTYDVKVQLLGFNGCEMSNGVLLEKEITIAALEKPEFLEDRYGVAHNQCEGMAKGRMHLEMNGWKDGVYSWTLRRSYDQGELEVYHHCGEKLNGATTFDLWSLPEGKTIFTMWDACDTIYKKVENIKAAYVGPVKIKMGDCTPISCADRTDGSVTFVASHWDIPYQASVILDGDTALKDFRPVIKADGKAYFELKGQGAGIYQLATKDACERTVDSEPFDFTAFSAQNGMLTVDVDFDAEAAKCDVEKRVFKVTANGGTAPYVYSFTKGNATVQTTEATEKKSFNSQLLTDGTYVVTVTDKTDCKAVYDDGLTIKPSHTMKAKNRDVICGDIKQSLVYASIDNGTTLGLNYIAIDEFGKEYLPLQDGLAQYGICTFELPTNVTLKGLIAKVDEQCSVYADLEAMPLDESALAEAKVTIDTLIHQRCYGIDNAELRVDYSGPKTTYDMKLRLKNVDNPDVIVDTENKHGEELQFKFKDLAPGNYELYLVLAVGKCDAGLEPRKIQDISIKAIPHPFELIWDTVIQSTCYSKMNGNPAIEVHGWSEGNCTWELNKFNVDKGDYELEAKNTDAYPVSGDSAYWSSDHLDAGRYIISWTDYCHNTVLKKFEIEPLKEPSLKVLASSNTDLKCGYDKAYVDFHYEGGVPMNKRILIKYIPVGSSDEDWDFTTEELKAENTYRLYGFTPGSGNMGHKKAEGTDYVLTDEDNGLPDGKYHIFYEDTTKACKDDKGFATVEVQRPYVNLNLAKQDVLCLSEHTGVINIVPVRFGKNPVYYHYMDQYLDHYDIRDQGYNFGKEIFKQPEEQKKVFANREKFLSDMFSDVENISITAKNRSQKDLYKLMQDSIAKRGTNLKYPLSKFYKNGGIDYAVSDWIGFNMMPADMYYVTVNDIYGCQYKDSIEVKGPEDGLRVSNAIYPMGADPECNAEDRRIKFTCTGGYYPYFYNVVNKDDPKKDENDTSGSGMFGQDYVTGAVIEKYEENGKTFVDYTSKMLKSGTYEVSVVDKMGCIAKWEKTFDVKAKHALNAIPHVDLCDPTNDNKLELVGADHSNKYTLYVGHRSRCKYYPYCSVDDNNGGLQIVDGKKRHVHEYVCEETPCEPYDNCVEHRNVDAGTINYKVQENKNWVKKSGYGISGVPTGTVGLLATMSDGCTAFDEYTFVSSGLPTSLTQIAMDSVNCNGGNDGAITFGLYGGHGYYSRILLDGEDLINSHQNVLMREVHEEVDFDEKTGKVIPTYTTTESLLSVKPNAVGLLNNKPLFEKLKKYYDGEALYAQAVEMLKANGFENPGISDISNTVSFLKKEYGKYQYFFRIDNLDATLNWEGIDKEKNKKHILTVVDEQECQTSMEFDIYQPTKLNLDIAASVICPDGSGRIYAESTTGGVPPYEYRMNEATNADFAAVFNANTGKKPKTYEGVELENPAAYESYYVDNYHVGDHIPAGKGQTHYMWVKDANGCEMKSSNGANLSEIWDWDKVEQDQLISTWHDYGDVLVVTDKTNYSMVHPSAEYDSMKVIVVMNSDDKNANKFEGITQPKERFAFGVKECSFELDEGKIIEKCYSANTPFGDFDTPSWGIPSNAIARYDTAVAKGLSLNPIHTYFHQLIPDEALRRMSFVKFQTKAGEEVNLKEMIGNKQDYHLNFLIRVVAYVGGCDIVTEHNPLVLNLQGDDPFPKANYKDVISVDAFPNPVAKDGKCTLKVTLSNNENEFSYAVYSLDGKRIRHYTVRPSDNCKVVEKADGNTDYIYEIVVDGLNETSIVKVTTETNTAAVKILVK